jgi:hypothetical protein
MPLRLRSLLTLPTLMALAGLSRPSAGRVFSAPYPFFRSLFRCSSAESCPYKTEQNNCRTAVPCPVKMQ